MVCYELVYEFNKLLKFLFQQNHNININMYLIILGSRIMWGMWDVYCIYALDMNE